ncbi:DUF2867 domain-containing protein [Dethiosulfatarculus sandiegensis]|uniref:DUF2867 domain-containing protein n=1 Tax=Dethiosulfatarculus sandiegensis TaxID=1429043 RepID=A0A0D2JQJ0_9BACT|nr:DUF2867 domain-containing protein [Dethiosulfatarculus sandiegensis]KIX11765.1 hypothetical protein X474_22795 [Dethiosulfatarculus sandiegensis]
MKQSPTTDDSVFHELKSEVDHLDTKYVTTGLSMAGVVAEMFSYKPGWYKGLYIARGWLARILGLEHSPDNNARITEDQVPEKPGQVFESLGENWKAHKIEPGRFWSMAHEAEHLTAWVFVQKCNKNSGVNEYAVSTLVKYKNPVGRFYFNLIKPFHHLIVKTALRYIEKSTL